MAIGNVVGSSTPLEIYGDFTNTVANKTLASGAYRDVVTLTGLPDGIYLVMGTAQYTGSSSNFYITNIVCPGVDNKFARHLENGGGGNIDTAIVKVTGGTLKYQIYPVGSTKTYNNIRFGAIRLGNI